MSTDTDSQDISSTTAGESGDSAELDKLFSSIAIDNLQNQNSDEGDDMVDGHKGSDHRGDNNEGVDDNEGDDDDEGGDDDNEGGDNDNEGGDDNEGGGDDEAGDDNEGGGDDEAGDDNEGGGDDRMGDNNEAGDDDNEGGVDNEGGGDDNEGGVDNEGGGDDNEGGVDNEGGGDDNEGGVDNEGGGDDRMGDDHEGTVTSIDEFIMSNFLPAEIPESVLKSSDEFANTLKTTLKENINFFSKFMWQLQDGKMNCKMLDLTLPEAYSTHLRNAKSLMENIIQLACQVVKKTDYVALPKLDIQALHSFIYKNKIFQAVDVRDAELHIPFTTATGRHVTRSYFADRTVKLVLEKLCDIICTFAPADHDHKAHHPAMIKLWCGEAEFCGETNATQIVKSLKTELKKFNKCKLCNISFNDIQVRGRKRSNAVKITRKVSVASSLSANQQQTATSGLLRQVMMQMNQKPGKLTTISKNNPVRFTFDSFDDQLNAEPSDLNTAYGYWQLDIIHRCATGNDCTIAIIDDGIDPGHPGINENNISDFWDFSTEDPSQKNPFSPTSHGTMCAGVACGNSFSYFPADGVESHIFPDGVAPKAKMLVYKIAFDIPNSYNQLCLALKKTLEWHEKELKDGKPGVDVVSLSLGSLQFVHDIAQEITKLVCMNIIIVCAASNSGHKFSQPIDFPARLGPVLCIGSHGPHGKPSVFSPVGQQIDFLAPGKDISAPGNNARYSRHIVTRSGTSLATPAIAGLICLILDYIKKRYSEQRPDIVKHFHNHWTMKEILREISTSPGRHSEDRGYGALNPIQFFVQPDRILESILIQNNAGLN